MVKGKERKYLEGQHRLYIGWCYLIYSCCLISCVFLLQVALSYVSMKKKNNNTIYIQESDFKVLIKI